MLPVGRREDGLLSAIVLTMRSSCDEDLAEVGELAAAETEEEGTGTSSQLSLPDFIVRAPAYEPVMRWGSELSSTPKMMPFPEA